MPPSHKKRERNDAIFFQYSQTLQTSYQSGFQCKTFKQTAHIYGYFSHLAVGFLQYIYIFVSEKVKISRSEL